MSENNLEQIYKLNFNTSLSHIIGNITMVTIEEYKKLFPKGLFKSFYLNKSMNARMFIQKKKDILDLKQSKPVLAVNPTVSTDIPEFATSFFNMSYGKDVYMNGNHNPMTSTLFYEKSTHTILEFSINRIIVNYEMTHIYESLVQQLNALGVMRSSMRIEHPYRFLALLEVPIPASIIDTIIKRLHLEGQPINVILDTINKYSLLPIVHKLKTSNGKYCFFFVIRTSIQIKLENPSINDGEQKGMVSDNYEISQNVNIEFNYVDTIYMISKNKIDSSLQDQNNDDIMKDVTIVPVLSTITGMTIPQLNINGKTFYTASELLMDAVTSKTRKDITNISGLLTVYDFEDLKSISQMEGRPLHEIFDQYYDIEFYKTDQLLVKGEDYDFNSKTMELTTFNADIFSHYSILIYRDNVGLNSKINKQNEYFNK